VIYEFTGKVKGAQLKLAATTAKATAKAPAKKTGGRDPSILRCGISG
jgi:hypothetical protein